MNEIRPAVAEDGPSILQMVRALQTERRVGSPDALSETLIRNALFGRVPSVRAFVAETGVSLAGLAFYAPSFSIFRAGPALHVDFVYVKPSYRGSGVARALLAAIAGYGRDHGIGAITWLSARAGEHEERLVASLGVRPHDNLRFVRVPIASFERRGIGSLPWSQKASRQPA